MKRTKGEAPEAQQEPLFGNVRNDDPAIKLAHAMAANSVDQFVAHINRPGGHTCAAKLRFRAPDLSEQLGEDRFLFIWLTSVEIADDGELAGTFFEVPKELLQWHWPGQRLYFEREDIFDWFVNCEGSLHGGFTLRVTRSRLPEEERASYDQYIGVEHWG